jgi:SEC-C motif domain protein
MMLNGPSRHSMSAQQRSSASRLLCPCGHTDARGAGVLLARCCGPFLEGRRPALPVLLMRSRYSAYVLNDLAYIKATWWPGCVPSDLVPDVQTRWLGLEVKRSFGLPALPVQALPGVVSQRLGQADEGVLATLPAAGVEFVARYRVGGGPAARLHETSRFVFEAERWWYVDGVLQE